MKDAAQRQGSGHPSGHSEGARAWHALPLTEVEAALESGEQGLSGDEAAARLARFGPNRLPAPARRGPLRRFAAQFNNVLIYVLLGSALVTALLAHWLDTAVILGVVVINAVIGFLQEGKAERALDAIRDLLSPSAAVLRDGRRQALPAEELVPGDLVLLEPGDRVPADLRLVRAKGLQAQEAALTGESLPVDKTIEPVAEKAALGDRASMAWSGTLVTHGQGAGLVVATGAESEIGRISGLLAGVESVITPLLRQFALFGRWLTAAIVLLAGLTFAFGVLVRGYAPAEMFLAAVALAVAAIPEGLPAIMTITLAIGVERMARRNAIIRRLPAVEVLGSVSVICSDKTGTLTRNEMTVQTIATAGQLYELSGTGYAPEGRLTLEGQAVDPADHPVLEEMGRGALLCGDATLRRGGEDDWRIEGDPTEGALVVAAHKAGLDPEQEDQRHPRADVIPFESEHRFMATLHQHPERGGRIYVKGAPERILEMCERQRQPGARAGEEVDAPLDRAYWEARMEEMAGRGERILALATRKAGGQDRELELADVESGLVLVGLFGLADPPRPEAIEAVARCRKAGIAVKMITGDHAATAAAIARQVGLETGTGVLTGADLDALDDAELAARVADTTVFARTSPQHKLRLVKALQAQGLVVAMTGDGVNDAPALKRADVGVAMGRKGTEAAKEAAAMVLADDNFASIAHAVEEGRTVYDNLKKSVLFILPTSGGAAFTIILAILLGQLLPITAAQVLWINLITTVTLALALAFEPAEGQIMRRPPRAPGEPILSGFLVWRLVFVTGLMVAATFGIFLWLRGQGAGLEEARTAAVNTIVLCEALYLFNTRFLAAPSLSRAGLLGSRTALLAVALVIVFQLFFTYAPPFQFLFRTEGLEPPAWGAILLVACALFLLVELEKLSIHWLLPGQRPR